MARAFGLDATRVRESVWLPELTPVEEAPPWVVGLFSLRGRIVPVADLNLRFRHPARRYIASDQVVVLEVDNQPMGLIVSEVREVIDLPYDAIQPPPQFDAAAPGHVHLVAGEARVGDDLVTLLDVPRLTRLLDGVELAEAMEQMAPAGHFCPEATPEASTLFRARAVALREAVAEDDAALLSGVYSFVVLLLVIGACQPYMYRRPLRDVAKKAGFNSSLVQIFDLLGIARRANEEVSKAAWTRRTINEIKADIESIKQKPALHVQSMPINPAALVVGGGIGGMQSALSLANRGIPVHLVEKSSELGGFAGNMIASTIDGLQPMNMAKDMKLKVFEHKNITVHLNAEVRKTEGTLGSFESKIAYNGNGEKTFIHHGAVIMATGGHEGKTEEYCYGQSERILTQFEFKQKMEAGSLDLSDVENVVMIQCVGSREEGKREYCSRICCMWAVANALKIKEINPEVQVLVLYRDIMTYGFLEQYYTKARSAGVIFINYDLQSKPEVEIAEGKLVMRFNENILNTPVEISPDYLVLSTGVDPEPSNKELAESFSLAVNRDGFFSEADSKWRPVEFKQIGTFLAGAAHSPMPLPDVLMQAEAAAQKAYTYLSGGTINTARVISTVKDALCVRCQRCVAACPFEARSYNAAEDRIDVDLAACQGCGLCAVTCRNNAAEVSGWSDKQIMAVIDAKLVDDLVLSTAP